MIVFAFILLSLNKKVECDDGPINHYLTFYWEEATVSQQ